MELVLGVDGSGVILVNLRVIGILAKRLTKGGVAAPVGIFTGKFALLLIICYVLVVVVKVDVLAFIAGLSTAYLSLVLSTMWGVDLEEETVLDAKDWCDEDFGIIVVVFGLIVGSSFLAPKEPVHHGKSEPLVRDAGDVARPLFKMFTESSATAL